MKHRAICLALAAALASAPAIVQADESWQDKLKRQFKNENVSRTLGTVAGALLGSQIGDGRRLRSAVSGALSRVDRSRRPRPGDIDWPRTIHANLRHWLPEHQTLVPERLIAYGRRARSLERDVIVAVDQSASMADSIVYASVLGSVLAGIAALRTRLIVFDTAVADLTEELEDPVDVLFGVQLGGGTDIANAVAYCSSLVSHPRETLLIVISDLYEGGDARRLEALAADLAASGVTLIVLLSLSDEGTPSYDHAQAATLQSLGATVFAATPDHLPELLANALQGHDISQPTTATDK